jgi:hypothetical protein
MARLNGLRLPDESRFLRRIPRIKADDPDFVAAFDRHTLFYDVFHEPGTGEITIVAPSLRSQRRLFRQLVVKVDGKRIDELKVELLSPRTSQIRFPSPSEEPKTLRVMHKGAMKLNAQIQINRANTEKFAGKNALVAISKNNKLSWIRDWLTYYVDQHGANAVVLIDNGSDQYDLRDLRLTMLSVDGIEALEILSAPYPFGPKAVDRMSVNSKFLHLSALHVAHRRCLARANAVLSVDIDELVTRPGDQTVFEAVKDTPMGFLSIKGEWRYARRPEEAGQAIRHADHVLQRIGPDAQMQRKWCVDPTGPLAGNYWKVHGVLKAKRNYDHPFKYLHCRQITTNWDYDRDFEPEERFEMAEESETLQRVFG